MMDLLIFIVLAYISIAFIFFIYLTFNRCKVSILVEGMKVTLEDTKKYYIYLIMSLLWPKTFVDFWRCSNG